MNKTKEITNSLLNAADGERATKEDEIDSYQHQFGHHAVDSHRNVMGATVFSNKDNAPLNLKQFSLHSVSNASQNGGVNNKNEKDGNLSEGKIPEYGDENYENYAKNEKGICSAFDISTVRMCFSSDEVGVIGLYNESISHENIQVVCEEKAELFCDIV